MQAADIDIIAKASPAENRKKTVHELAEEIQILSSAISDLAGGGIIDTLKGSGKVGVYSTAIFYKSLRIQEKTSS